VVDEPDTIPTLIAERAARLGGASAIVSDDEVLTYGALDERSRAVTRRLVAAGVGTGSRVGLLMGNSIEWAVTAYGILRMGAVLVPLSTLLRPPELHAQLATAHVSVLIAQPEYRGRRYLDELEAQVPGVRSGRQPGLPNLRHAWAGDAVPTDLAPESLVTALESRVGPAHDLAVMFTSGSRGTPKGVIHTHGGAIRATRAGLASRCIGEGERLYIPMPFFWMGGFGTGLLSALIAGATLLTETRPTPASTIAFLERERATLFRGWPDQATRIAADPAFASADLSSLGPGSLDPVLPARLRSQPGARANVFGMTESFGPYCGYRLDTDLPDGHQGSCGRPFQGTEVRAVDTGELQLRGPNLMRAICGRLRSDVFTFDGWLPTGDLGRIDDAGFVFFGGRVDDMFKVSGATVYPSEVEAGLRSIPFVTQAYVTDVIDASGASAVGALVVLSEDRSLDEVMAEARERLSSFKVPKHWLLARSIDAVPMLATGKLDKSALQALLAPTRDA
jgi:acyl-CoA synthetase (AMP-forming)/AMP-acid ligase II